MGNAKCNSDPLKIIKAKDTNCSSVCAAWHVHRNVIHIAKLLQKRIGHETGRAGCLKSARESGSAASLLGCKLGITKTARSCAKSLSALLALGLLRRQRSLRAETLSHAAGLTAHTCVVLYGSSKFLGRDELAILGFIGSRPGCPVV